MTMTDIQANATLEQSLRTAPRWVSLHTSATTSGGGGTEVAAGGYARKQVTFAVPANRSCSNSAAVIFDPATAPWGTVGWFALWDSAVGGNMLRHAPLGAARPIIAGDSAIFEIGQLVCNQS